MNKKILWLKVQNILESLEYNVLRNKEPNKNEQKKLIKDLEDVLSKIREEDNNE